MAVSSWVYEAIDNLKTQGVIRSVPSSSRPWTRGYAVRLIQEADNCEPGLLSGSAAADLRWLRGEFASELGLAKERSRFRRRAPLFRVPADTLGTLDGDWFSRLNADTANQSLSLGTRFNITTPSWLALHNQLEFTAFRKEIRNDTNSPDSMEYVPGTREHAWMNRATLDIPEAYLKFRLPWLNLKLGRDFVYWGPAFRSSVILSSTAPSLDQIQLTADFRRFKFIGFTAALSPWQGYNRFLSGQRLEVNFWDRLVVAGNMLVADSPDSAQTKSFFGYLNPLIPIYFEVANSGHDDNLLVGADAAYYLSRAKLYAAVMLDNLEFIRKVPDTTELLPPDAYGIQLGIKTTPLAALSLQAEYARLTRYTYYHRIFQTAYVQYGVPLGHRLGPDADELFVQADWTPCDFGSLSWQASLVRRGDKNRDGFLNKTWVPRDAIRPTQFPSGTVENTITLGPQVTLHPEAALKVIAGAYWFTRTNALGELGRSQTGFVFNARIEYRYY